MMHPAWADRSPWVAGLLALLLAGCGGGGGATRADPPPQGPPPTPPPPPPTVVEPPNPLYGNHLSWTGASAAHAAGLTGAGVRIGIVDSGVNRNHPALAGRVVANLAYISRTSNNLNVDDVVGHGTAVAQIAAGKPFGQWPGGIAPGAEIVSARIISDTPPQDDGSGQGNQVNGALGLAPVHQDLISRGVRVMNNSWGGLYWTNRAATAPIAEEYRPFIINHGGLVVFSTGNSGFANPSDMAALPSQTGTGGTLPAADLERGWLAVAALDETDPTRLASYSNACGSAMRYCLVAPGTVIATGTNNPPNAPDYWRWRGTSFSAPIVSGAAALVWEAFPYFSNDQVRQTLLGTATDLGEPGVDAVFGYGSLDIARAIGGPARFDWGDFVADFSGTSTWSNAISGDGGLVKRGSGRLVLTRLLDYRGTTRVEAGVLAASHNLPGPVAILAGATLEFGGANIAGNVVNQGNFLFTPDRSNLAINGNYAQSATGRFGYAVGAPLRVEGTASLAGELQVARILPGYTYRATEDVLIANGGVSGTFDRLTSVSSLFLQGALRYTTHSVLLDITRLDVAAAAKALPGIGAAGLSSAQRLERAFDGIDHRQQEAGAGAPDAFMRVAGEFQRLDDPSQARSALDSLSGESHALATALTFDAIDMGRRGLSARFDQPRTRGESPATWMQSLGHGGNGGIAGGGYQLDGWLLGREQPLGALGVAGFAFGEQRAEGYVGGNRDRSRDRMVQGMAYAARTHGDGYWLGRFGVGRFDRGIERLLFAGDGARQGVSSRYAGDYASVDVEAGHRYTLGVASLTPYLGADSTRVRSGGFHEWGGNGFGLEAGAADLRRTQAIAGVRAERDWRGATFRAYGEWQQVLDADGFDVQARFTGIDSWSPLPLADAARSGGLFGVGFGTHVSRNAALSFGFDQRFGPRGDERMASLRYAYGF